MADSPRIILFGATGFTGRLTAQAMADRGLKPVLAGRNKYKLEELASSLGKLDVAQADVGNPSSLAAIIDRGDVLVTCVGPFTLYGEAALAAAVSKGAHYIDSTGEAVFIRKVFEEYGPRAKAANVALVTAGGFDFVPGNCVAGVALRAAGGEAVRVDVGYFSPGDFAVSQGTRLSILASMVDPGMMFESGGLVERYNGLRVRTFEIGGKQRPALSLSSTEHYSLPKVFPGLTDINVFIGWFGQRAYAMQKVAKVQVAFLKLPGVRPAVRAILSLAPRSRGAGPDVEVRSRSRSLVIGEALDKEGRRLSRAELSGGNGYDFTAAMLVWMAEAAAKGGLKGVGALGPVEAFGLDELIVGCRQAGLDLKSD